MFFWPVFSAGLATGGSQRSLRSECREIFETPASSRAQIDGQVSPDGSRASNPQALKCLLRYIYRNMKKGGLFV